MKINWKKPAVWIYLVAIVFVCVAVSAVSIYQQSADALRWRKHTYDVIVKIHQIRESVLEQESSLRGYVPTHQRIHLDRYTTAYAEMPKIVIQLEQLTYDNKEQQDQIDIFQSRYRAWERQFADHVVALPYGKPLSIAQSRILMRDGEDGMKTLFSSLERMSQIEFNLLEDRQRHAYTWWGYLGASFLGLMLLPLLMGFLTVKMIKKAMPEQLSLTSIL